MMIGDSKFSHLIVKFPSGSTEICDDRWSVVLDCLPVVSKSLSKKLGLYVRCIGVGAVNENLHVHYLVKKEDVVLFRQMKAKLNVVVSIAESKKDVFSIEGLLDYFFDMNFYFAYLDVFRPKRVRVLSASRGIYCGFPARRKKKVAL